MEPNNLSHNFAIPRANSAGDSALGLGLDMRRMREAVCGIEPVQTPEQSAEQSLTEIGLEPREMRADQSKVDPDFKTHIMEYARELLDGEIPERGFGIFGETGVGKTYAMTCLFRVHFLARIRKTRAEGGRGRKASEVYCWVDWPAESHWMRSHAVSASEWVSNRVKKLCTVPVLILDDLGSERRKGDYQEDYACGELDYIISARYRACLPTWYTTNLTSTGLAQFYGARMISRLCGENPLVELRGRDRRIAGR